MLKDIFNIGLWKRNSVKRKSVKPIKPKTQDYSNYELLEYSWRHWNMGKYLYTPNDEMMENNEEKLKDILQPTKIENIYSKKQVLIGKEKGSIDALNQRIYEKIFGTKRRGLLRTGKLGKFPSNIGEYFNELTRDQRYTIYCFWFSLLKPEYQNVFIKKYENEFKVTSSKNETRKISSSSSTKNQKSKTE